jgi:hypothetical protein
MHKAATWFPIIPTKAPIFPQSIVPGNEQVIVLEIN